MLAKPAIGNGSVTSEIAPAGKYSAGRTMSGPPTVTRLVSGLQGGSGSTIGPDGALYVAETAAGRVLRVDPKTGGITEFARGLPKSIVGLGGVMDIAFVDQTAYVLVTLVGTDVKGSDVDGIYEITGLDSFTVIADIGRFSVDNPPSTPFDVPTGVQYAMQPYRGGFLVTDGHHNRVLQVGLVDCGTELDDCVTQLIQFGNIVPTGLAVRGNTIYMAEAGPIPHLPQSGKIESFKSTSRAAAPIATVVASGAPLLVDVEFGRGGSLYGLAQGTFSPESGPGAPANPNTGELVEVNRNGTFSVITAGLNQPTSLEFIGNTAYVVTLTGEIWKIDNVSPPPFGR